MTTDATTSPHPGLALPICLAIIVLPPLLAIIIAAINSLTQRYGHALYRVLCLVFCVAAYAAQVAMVLGTTACIYYSFGAYTIHMDPSMPSALAPLYCAVLSLSFGLGFLAIMMVGLYLFEAVLSQTVKKTPTQLTIVETAVSCTGAIVTCGWEQVKRLQPINTGLLHISEAEVAGPKKGSSASKGQVTPAEQLRDVEDSSDETSSMIDTSGFSGIEEWK